MAVVRVAYVAIVVVCLGLLLRRRPRRQAVPARGRHPGRRGNLLIAAALLVGALLLALLG